MNEWNNLFFLNEADDDEEKNKDKKQEKSSKSENKSKEEDDKYNDLMDDEDDSMEDDIDLDEEKDTESSDSDDDYNNLMDDESSESEDFDDDNDFMKDDDSEDDSDYNTLVVIKTDGDKSEDTNVYEKAVKVAYVYTVIANNFKHIHLNASGTKFQEIHNMCDEYYHHFSNKSDFYYELAAESPFIALDNPTRAKEHCEDISVEMDKEYNFRKALETISTNFSSAIKYLDELREAANNLRPDIQSRVDDELSYINKQIKYFIRKKLSGEDNSIEESYNYNSLL